MTKSTKTPKTTFAGLSPFSGPAPAKPEKKPAQNIKIDPATIVRSRAPYEPVRRNNSKFDALLQNLREGDCWEFEGEHAAKQANAFCNTFRKWLKVRGQWGLVRERAECADGKARVWLIKYDPNPKALKVAA